MRRAVRVSIHACRLALGAMVLLPVFWLGRADSQPAPKPPSGHDSVTIAAGPRYQGGGLRRLFLGDTYRDLWATPIKVPVLNLQTFAGGLKPTKTGGGNQTRSLRFLGADGLDYAFRLVEKDNATVPKGFNGTIVSGIARDQVSAHHPGAAVTAAPILAAAGVLHVTPILAVMPDDAGLGEFRAEFAGQLGMIEVYPSTLHDAPGFAGALEVIDSDTLRALLDRSPGTRVDSRAVLKARLVDMFLNDWDRHAGNWKWARFQAASDAVWVPIPRDRDKPFIQYGGIVGAAGKVSPNLMGFKDTYPSVRGLTYNSLELDRRLLSGLEKPVWDSIALDLHGRITNPVIIAAVRAMPPEYQALQPDLAARLRIRRDSIPAQADRFYRFLAGVLDLHASDSADRATVFRHADGSVEVQLLDGGDTPLLRRRFRPEETGEIRLYLHGGDDTAIIRGAAPGSIPVRIIGGNGSNRLVDSSVVGGRLQPTHLYDVGTVTGVRYGPDTLLNRRPWVHDDGRTVKPGPDRGGRMAPIVGLTANGDLGIILKLGMNQYRYAFRTSPYATRISLTAEYATEVNGFRVVGALDRRTEGSPLHLTFRARMSEFEVVSYHGLGNTTPVGTSGFFRVEQRQWLLQPAVAFSLSDRSDISLGPVIQYSTTDGIPGTFLSATRPYGVGSFGQAGVRVGVYLDKRDQARDPRKGILLDVSGTWYPGVWDVRSAFGDVAAATAAYLTLPVPFRPVLVVRGAARKLFGDFPFHESAFLGGRGSVRRLDLQRYAGDAALSGTAELQVPLARFPLIVPFDLGIYGFADVGRVYVAGLSPGGWHTGAGVGLWIGVLSPSTGLNLELGDRPGRSLVRVRTGLNF